MTPMPLLLLAAAAVGVDTGWTKLDTGGYEYIIQISPEQLESLRAGGEIGSDLPAGTGAIRSYKVVVGRGPLAHQGEPLPADAQVSFKPVVETPAANGEKVETQKVQAPPRTGPNLGSPTRPAPQDIFNSAGRANAEKSAAKATDDSATLEDPDLLEGNTREKSNARDAEETPARTNRVKSSKLEDEPADEGPTSPNPSEPKEPETEKAELSSWDITWWVVLFLIGAFAGWPAFLAWDFRNRYLELLHDLDDQPSDTDLPSEPAYVPEREPEPEAEVHEEEEEEVEERHSRRDFVRTPHVPVGRRQHPQQHRRRERDEENYDEE